MRNRLIIDKLKKLKRSPIETYIDHILLLREIYNEYSNGNIELKPIALFFLNGFDELPTLSERSLWNQSKFNEIRKDFIKAHNELIPIIDSTLSKLKHEGTLSKSEFLLAVKSGRKRFENIDLENLELQNQNFSGLTFTNCIISSDFRYSNLSRTRFLKSNVKTSDFRNTNLSNGLMQNVSFEGTKFKGAITKGFMFLENYCYSANGIGQADFEDWIKDTE